MCFPQPLPKELKVPILLPEELSLNTAPSPVLPSQMFPELSTATAQQLLEEVLHVKVPKLAPVVFSSVTVPAPELVTQMLPFLSIAVDSGDDPEVKVPSGVPEDVISVAVVLPLL